MLVALLRAWIRCFTMIISAWWHLASSKLEEVGRKFNRKTWKHRQLLSESGFALRIAPQPLSRDRRIKMKKIPLLRTAIKDRFFLDLVIHEWILQFMAFMNDEMKKINEKSLAPLLCLHTCK